MILEKFTKGEDLTLEFLLTEEDGLTAIPWADIQELSIILKVNQIGFKTLLKSTGGITEGVDEGAVVFSVPGSETATWSTGKLIAELGLTIDDKKVIHQETLYMVEKSLTAEL